MGRPSCSSCCKVSVAQKKGCIDNNYKVYYKYGAGGWKTSDEYAAYLAREGKNSGFKSLQEIKYVSSKSDYGEYASELNCWNFPKAFFDVNKTAVEINEEFQGGNPDYGVHIPKFWTITLGDNDEMVIVRKLKELGSFTNYIERDAFESYLNSLPKTYGSGPYSPTAIDANMLRSWYYALTGGLPSSPPPDVQMQEKTYTVIWTTEILYKSQTIFSGSKCIPYKKEFHMYNNGAAITNAYAVSREDSSNPENCWSATRDMSGCGFLKGDEVFTQNLMYFSGMASTVIGSDFIEELMLYSNFDYCLTFPFFSFDQNTHYFYEGPDSNFIPAPQGTIDEDLDGKLEFYHADKGLFTKISVMSKDFIVFNPYSGGLGRDVAPNELAQEYQGDTLKDQEKLVNTPFFQYTDNKLNLEGDIPQELTIEESPRGSLIEFPAGWPGDYAQPDGVRETFNKYTNTYSHPDYVNDVIFVHFRTNRGADESGIDIEEDMEVYHPVGSGNKYTIDEIVAMGPDLKPTKVKLSNGAVVDVSDIELVDDALYYAMNGRTYYLQTIYLKALSTKEGKDFFDPFKYRVTRIDFTNPDIDIDSVGDEIAGPPKMDVDENPTYITMTTEYSYSDVPESRKKPKLGEATFMKLTEDSPVTLEETENPPMNLKDDIVITAPTTFSGPSKYDPNTGEFVVNSNALKFPRSQNLYVKVLNNWVLSDPIGDGSRALTFSYRQLPKSGYFFGNFVNLKFYLQEIEEWKRA